MSQLERQQINRALVAILGVLCLLIGLGMMLTGHSENIWCGSFIRVGLLTGAFWVALPSKGRAAAWANISPWSVFGIVGGMLFVVRRPQILIPFGILLAFLIVIAPYLTGKRK